MNPSATPASTRTTLLARGLAAAVLALAGPAVAVGLLTAATAEAAPTKPGSAQETIDSLRSRGYTVIVNRVGTRPLSEASVVAIRPGQTFSRTDSRAPGAGDDLVTTVTGRTVYVDVA